MANRFISILDNIGHWSKIGVEKAFAWEEKALPWEEAAAQEIAVFDPPLGGSIMAILLAIGKVEQIASALNVAAGTGMQKLQAVLPDIEQIVLALPVFKGKTIANLDLFKAGLVGITDGFAKVLNAFQSSIPEQPQPVEAPAQLVPAAAMDHLGVSGGHSVVVTPVGKA